MPTTPTHRLALCLAVTVFMVSAHAAGPVQKCVIDGKVTFQSSPCAGDAPTRQPSVDELNAARKKRLAEAAAQAPAAPTPATGAAPGGSRQVDAHQPSANAAHSGFRCDGRTYCSQMRSCAEAKYFLAYCPGVKMDGDGDGTPCEQQWCTHPMAK